MLSVQAFPDQKPDEQIAFSAFILLKTINGIKDNVDKMYTLGNDDLQYMRDEFLGYLRRLVDVVNELHKEEETKA